MAALVLPLAAPGRDVAGVAGQQVVPGRQIPAGVVTGLLGGTPFEPELRDRRPGDPARIVASGEAAARDLGWAMRHDIDAMVASAWQAWTAASVSA